MAQVAKIKQLSQKETKYVRINYKGEVIDADKSLLKILLSKNTDKKKYYVILYFFCQKKYFT